MAHLAVDQRELLVGHAFEQIPVVRHHDERARPGVKHVLHDSEHIGVEVVTGLVHDEHVRQDEQELHAALLPARQVGDGRHELRGAEAQALHHLPRRRLFAVHDVAGLVSAQYLFDLVFAEFLKLVELLRQHGELHGLADFHMAERGFYGAVD